MLVQKPILIQIGLFDKLQNIVVADVDIQILVEHTLNLIDANQPSLLPIEQRKHIQCLLLPPPPEKPFLGDQLNDLSQGETFFLLVDVADLVFDLLAVHFGVGEVPQDASEVLPAEVAAVAAVVEGKGVLDFVLLGRTGLTMSSESLLLRLFLPLLFAMFFFTPFIGYKIIDSKRGWAEMQSRKFISGTSPKSERVIALVGGSAGFGRLFELKIKISLTGGFEPPTFRLTAERSTD